MVEKKEFENKLPYVLVELDGTQCFIEEVKAFLNICLDWFITEDIKPIVDADVLVNHGVDEGAEHGTAKFWIIKKGKLKGLLSVDALKEERR